MTLISKLQFNLHEIRSLVLDSLKGVYDSTYHQICNSVAYNAIEKGIVENPDKHKVFGAQYDLNPLDQDNVREILWNLVFEGILTLGINSSNPSWPYLRVTEYGKKVLASEPPVPHDPSGYLNKLKTEIPDLDPVIFTYIQESLRAYNINCLLSATITLGCASEKALLLLIDQVTEAFHNEERRSSFYSKTSGRQMKRQFEELSKVLEGIKGKIPGDVSDGLNTVLLGVFEMIRNNRNDAGHPTGKSIEKDVIFANLQVFVTYCKKVYQLISYFKNNSIT